MRTVGDAGPYNGICRNPTTAFSGKEGKSVGIAIPNCNEEDDLPEGFWKILGRKNREQIFPKIFENNLI